MNKVLLAFSGGLDTSYCARYLAVDCGFEVHSVVVNTGGFSDLDLRAIALRAATCKVASHTSIDRTEQLYQKVLRYCIAGNVLKNGTYPLSVSAERIVQALAIAEHALQHNFTHIAHGSTGAGNDQIRFDVVFRTLCPHIEILTPIRDMQLSRDQEITYLETHGVSGDWTKAAYSINQGIWGTTIGGRETLTSDQTLPDQAWYTSLFDGTASALPPREIVVGFEQGEPVSLDGERMSAVEVIRVLNDVGNSYQAGRDMHVGDTIIGIKGRIAFEAPAALMLIAAHHVLEKHTLSKWQLTLKDQLSTWYGQLLHEGQFLDPAMRSIEQFFTHAQQRVTGDVRIRLSYQRFDVLGMTSPFDVLQNSFATYGEVHQAWTGADAKGYAVIASVSARLQRGEK